MKYPRYSVIIPAFNEERLVHRAIASVCRQEVPRTEVEILVIDNGSTDDTSAVAREAGADRVLTELRPGPNNARQRGLKAARGKIVAFLDADCEAPADWLSSIGHLLSTARRAVVTGPYDYQLQGPLRVAALIFFRYVCRVAPALTRLSTGRSVSVLMGGNFAARRDCFSECPPLPDMPFFGDDTAISIHLSYYCGSVYYASSLVVKSSDRRFRAEGFFRTTLRYAYHYCRVALCFKPNFGTPSPDSPRDGQDNDK